MEININNAFRIAVKLSCAPCLSQYRRLTERSLETTHQLVDFFLRKPLLSTLFCATFLLIVVTALSVAFIALVAVSFLIIKLLLIGGFILITCAIVISMSLFNLIVIAIVIYGIKLNFLTAIKT